MLRSHITLAAVLLAMFTAACGSSTTSNTSSNVSSANTTVNANTTNPLETKKAEAEKVTNNAPTLTPVFKAFCGAWVKNDEAALRKVYAQETIKHFENEMKAEKTKSLIKYLEATDKVSGTPCEVTNEKINGDTALGTIHSDKYPVGIEIVFVKENGEWKMTNNAPSALDLKKPGPEANSAK